MRFHPILAAPPWHWWISVILLVLDGIILVGLAILYYRMVVVPARSMQRAAAIDASGSVAGINRRAGVSPTTSGRRCATSSGRSTTRSNAPRRVPRPARRPT